MLHNPYCSPSTSRAAKTSGVNYIPPGLVSLEPRFPDIARRTFGHGETGEYEALHGRLGDGHGVLTHIKKGQYGFPYRPVV